MICVITGNRLSIRSIALFFSSFSAFCKISGWWFRHLAKAVSVAPALLHRLQKFRCVVAAAVARKLHGGGTAPLHTAERHTFQGLAVLGGGIRKAYSEYRRWNCHRLSGLQSPCRSVPAGGIRSAAGLGKFVQHGFQVSAGFGGGNTVLGKVAAQTEDNSVTIVVGSCRLGPMTLPMLEASSSTVVFTLVPGGNPADR